MASSPRSRSGSTAGSSASRRTANAAARASGGRAAARAGAAGGNQNMVMVGVGVVVVVLVAFFALRGGSTPAKPTADPAAAKPAAAKPAPVESAPPPAARGFGEGEAKAGKPPRTPAPEIDLAQIAKADAAVELAKAKKNEAETARRAGDHSAFKSHLDAAMTAMQQCRSAVEPYTDWLEEADLEGWAMPASYVSLQARLGAWDKLFQQIKKINPNH